MPYRPDSDGATPLYVACQNGRLECVRTLLRLPPSLAGLNSPKASGATPLYVAAQKGLASVVHELLQAGAEVDTLTHAGASALFVSALQVGMLVPSPPQP